MTHHPPHTPDGRQLHANWNGCKVFAPYTGEGATYSVQNRKDKRQQNNDNKVHIVDKGSCNDVSSFSMYLFPHPPPPPFILVEVLKYFCDVVVNIVTSKIYNREKLCGIWGFHRGDIEDPYSLACDAESLDSCHLSGIPEKPGSSKRGILSDILPTDRFKHSGSCL